MPETGPIIPERMLFEKAKIGCDYWIVHGKDRIVTRVRVDRIKPSACAEVPDIYTMHALPRGETIQIPRMEVGRNCFLQKIDALMLALSFTFKLEQALEDEQKKLDVCIESNHCVRDRLLREMVQEKSPATPLPSPDAHQPPED